MSDNLELLLDKLSLYGDPKLSKRDNGWYCYVDVFVVGEGIQFKASSNFGEPTASTAVEKCLFNLTTAITQMTTVGRQLTNEEL